MRLNKFVNNLIAIKNASLASKLYVNIYKNSLTLRVLVFLYRNGYVLGFQYITPYKIRVFLKYFKHKGLLSDIVFPSLRMRFCSYLKLVSLYRKSSFSYLTIISTPKGLYTIDYIIRHRLNVGGLVLFSVCFF
jgi:ribosomal protein S8